MPSAQRCSPVTASSARLRARSELWLQLLPDVLAPASISQLAAIKIMFVFYALLGIVGGLFYARIPRRHPAPEAATAAAWAFPAIVYRLAICSVSMLSPAASSFNRCWHCGCFNALTCRFRQPACSFSGPACSRPSHSRWPPGCRDASGSSTRWSSRISLQRCLMLAAVAPTLDLALVLLLFRSALSQMDVPTRSSYVMAVVTEPSAPPRQASPPCPAVWQRPRVPRWLARCSPLRSALGRSSSAAR